MSSTAGHTAVVGQFAVVKSEYGWNLVRVESVTAKQFKGIVDRYGWKRTISAEKCKYCGDEAAARQLYDRLCSSQVLCSDERQKASDRKAKRDGELIAKATGAQ